MSFLELVPDGFEADVTMERIRTIPQKDQQIIFLAVTYFWVKCNGDPEIDSVTDYIDSIKKHPRRTDFFSLLADMEIHDICRALDNTFKTDELCIACEGDSYWDVESPAEFALGSATAMLNMEPSKQLPWFQEIDMHGAKRVIIEGVIRNLADTMGQSEDDISPLIPQLSD